MEIIGLIIGVIGIIVTVLLYCLSKKESATQKAGIGRVPENKNIFPNEHNLGVKVNWQNIDTALHKLIIHEQGILFQRLAISLAKQQWPEMIATQPHKDGGQDAYMPYFESNEKYLSVGCSITANYSKIKKDAERIIKRGTQLDTFIFYTPATTSNCKFDEWGKKLKSELGCDLQPRTKEDIIQELIKPYNHWMCREFLGLYVAYAPDIKTIAENANAASQEIIDQWKKNLRSNTFLIDLTINEKPKNYSQEINQEEIANKLSNKNRFVLYGTPGSGKTTTLIQVAQKLIVQDHVPLLLSIPEWIDSANDNIIDYLANNPCLSSKSITNNELLSLYKNGKLVFLLNGWNEVEQSNITKATRLLVRLNREYTAAGIILATRESSFPPPFYDESKLTIKELSNSQRRQLIQNLIPEEDISGQIENNHSLSQITRTPLFLIELIKIYQDNHNLPSTRVEIFEQVIRRTENSSEHSANLQSPPISRRSEYYLTCLSSYATRLGQVIIKYDNACREITAANNQLQQDGILQTIPESTAIINILCDHHLLVRSSYPDVTIRFVHQQFQEYFACLYTKKHLQNIVKSQNEQDICQFQEEIINYPIWEEPLKLLAEEIADNLETSSDEESLKFGEYLIRWAIPIDPVFAAKLVFILRNTIWNIVKNDFESILRKWYECPDENNKACALSAMFATGTDSFNDIIWPLLEHEDEQIRLTTYRTAKPFMISCLGDNWQNRINNWNEERRAEFLSELASNDETNVLDILENYAKYDPSQQVRIAAINEIGWYYSASRLHEIISTCDDEIFKIIIKDDYILTKIPNEQIPRATEAYLQFLKNEENQNKRLRLLLKMYELNKSNAIALLKKELENFKPERRDSLINDFLKKIASEDPDWVSQWVCQQVAHGNLYYDYYSDYITKVPESLIDELLKDFVKPDYSKQKEFETKKLIARGATQEHIHFILEENANLSSKFQEQINSISEPERKLCNRLIDTVREVPLQNLATVILKHYKKPDIIDLKLILNLLGLYRPPIFEESSFVLNEDIRSDLRNLLNEYVNFVLKENDYSGSLKANLSCALAFFVQPEDIALIKKLISKDIERLRKGSEAWKKGIRNGPQINGWRNGYADWHIRALLHFNSDEVEDYLIELLNEPEYETDAANGLIQLLWKDVPVENKSFGTHSPLTIGSHVWREEYIDPSKRKKYAQAIVQRINDKRKRDSCCGPKTLAGHLAKLNDPDTIPLILEILEVPQQFDARRRLDPLEMLVGNGHCLETTTVENIVNPAIEQATDIQISGAQDMYLLSQCLSILACTTDMEKAIGIIDKILAKHKLWYELRGPIGTLGNRKNSDAACYLIYLCQQNRLYNALCYELIEALGKTELPEAKEALLSTIDNSISSPKIPMPNDKGRSCLVQTLTNIYEADKSTQDRIISLCSDKSLSEKQKSIILSIVNNSPSNKSIIAAISMLSQDNNKCSIPYELENAVEKSVVQYVPIDDMPGSYNLRPQINSELSMHLFESVVNKRADWLCAFKLLGYINWLRIEYGRPQLEPRHPDISTQKPWPPLSFVM
ncbi:MAG: hypothetical protein H8D45_06560 [Bacteroidetes bacterium]|nr:hypothetical protein [Bacteroidota bacterium]